MRSRARLRLALCLVAGTTGCTADGTVKVTNAHVTAATTTTTATTAAPSAISPVTVAPTATPGTIAMADAASSFSGLAYDQIVPLAQKAIEAFWSKELPAQYGIKYKTLKGGVHGLKPGESGPGCRTSATTYDEVADNAFYCPDGDFLVYDDARLFPQLDNKFGPFVVAMVIAHEWGHAIQIRAGLDPTTSIAPMNIENQADCFAGAWTRWVVVGGQPGLHVGQRDIDSSLSGLLFFRDALGVTSAQPGAHGSGFDRVSAFQDGYANGVPKCATYLTNPPQARDLPFGPNDVVTGGNAPYDQLLSFMPQALDGFWATEFAARKATFAKLAGHLRMVNPTTDTLTCGGQPVDRSLLAGTDYYCSTDDYLAFDEPTLLRAPYQKIGDFATAVVLAEGWARTALARLGSPLTGAERDRAVDCAAGAFTGAVYQHTAKDASGQAISLSPGDLDEAISEFIGDGRAVPGSAFTRVATFRTGFSQGVSACGIG